MLNIKFRCTSIEQKTFEQIKHIATKQLLLEYICFNKCFGINTDRSNYQIGTVIS